MNTLIFQLLVEAIIEIIHTIKFKQEVLNQFSTTNTTEGYIELYTAIIDNSKFDKENDFLVSLDVTIGEFCTYRKSIFKYLPEYESCQNVDFLTNYFNNISENVFNQLSLFGLITKYTLPKYSYIDSNKFDLIVGKIENTFKIEHL